MGSVEVRSHFPIIRPARLILFTRAPPPTDSKPEASNFPSMVYTMSSDTQPFKAPEKYPDPPQNMYYEVPKTPTFQKPTPIFPWENSALKPTRVFAEDIEEETKSKGSTTEKDSEIIPTNATAGFTQLPSAWQSYSRGNAWDDIPEIENYIGNLQKRRRSPQLREGPGSPELVSSPGARRPSMKLTDFPTELERPSLPVTPAPIRRPNFWGSERNDEGELPTAEGVPQQADWVRRKIECMCIFELELTSSRIPQLNLKFLLNVKPKC